MVGGPCTQSTLTATARSRHGWPAPMSLATEALRIATTTAGARHRRRTTRTERIRSIVSRGGNYPGNRCGGCACRRRARRAPDPPRRTTRKGRIPPIISGSGNYQANRCGGTAGRPAQPGGERQGRGVWRVVARPGKRPRAARRPVQGLSPAAPPGGRGTRADRASTRSRQAARRARRSGRLGLRTRARRHRPGMPMRRAGAAARP
jgi:hypothetical protein